MASMIADARRHRPGPVGAGLQADQARRRRRAEGAVVAGRDAAAARTSPTAPRTRKARASSTSRSRSGTTTATWCPILAAEIPDAAERRRARRTARSVTLEAEEGRHLARRQAVHRRRRRLHLGIRARPGHRGGDDRLSTRTSRSTKVDDHTVRVSFKQADAVLGAPRSSAAEGMIIPKHLFGPYAGAKSREAPTNLKPVGTGPYKFVDFKPGDIVARRDQPELPHAEPALLRHDRDEGRRRRHLGGARRAADRRVRLRLEPAGRGRGAQAHGGRRQGQASTSCPAATSSSSSSTSPTPGTRSTASARSVKSKHFAFSDLKVREAMALLCDKKTHAGVHLRPHRHRDRELHEQPAALQVAEHEVGVQRRQGERRCSTPPAGRRAPTASAKRAARS